MGSTRGSVHSWCTENEVAKHAYGFDNTAETRLSSGQASTDGQHSHVPSEEFNDSVDESQPPPDHQEYWTFPPIFFPIWGTDWTLTKNGNVEGQSSPARAIYIPCGKT